MTPDVRICDDAGELSRRAADAVASAIVEAAAARNRCTVALAGGNTPRALYQLLATRFDDCIPWPRVHVFWGDERLVPVGDAQRKSPALPRPLLAICAKATAESPNARYANVPALAADLSFYLDGLPVSAYAENPLERLARFYKRHQIAILLITAYLIMRVLVLLLFRR